MQNQMIVKGIRTAVACVAALQRVGRERFATQNNRQGANPLRIQQDDPILLPVACASS